MFRWLFLILVLANIFPVFLSENRTPRHTSGLTDTGLPGSDDDGVRTIRLLAENGGSSAGDRNGASQQVNQALPNRRELRCFLVGPLASIPMSENYAQFLEAAGIPVGRHWREIVVGSDFWVYLPELPSSRATTRTLQELKANNIEGFIVSEGELKGAVALGVFTDRSVAEAERADFSLLGYDAKIHEMNRLAREYWLVSEEIPRPGIMEDLLKSLEVTEIPQKISRMDCKTVASAMQFQ